LSAFLKSLNNLALEIIKKALKKQIRKWFFNKIELNYKFIPHQHITFTRP